MSARISILMGVYNCEQTLPQAIDSIVNQTYTKWKLIICDDGSSDNTYSVAQSYKEKYPDKIILVKNDSNSGLNRTLNHCLKHADTEYCARMDGDDISMPERLEEEISFLDANPEYAIVSTDMEYFDNSGTWGKSNAKAYPQKEDFAAGSPFCHAPCMVRTQAYKAVNGYTENQHLLRVEDYHLWIKMYSVGYKGANLQKVLYKMRDDRNATKRRKYRYRINEAYVRYLGVKMLKLKKLNYIYILRPLIVGLLPTTIYEKLHKKRLSKG